MLILVFFSFLCFQLLYWPLAPAHTKESLPPRNGRGANALNFEEEKQKNNKLAVPKEKEKKRG